MKKLGKGIIGAIAALFMLVSCQPGQWAITGLQTPVGVVTKNADGTYNLKPKESEFVTVNPDGTVVVKPTENENVRVNEDGSITIIPKNAPIVEDSAK
jgi:hypothetical protein